jgi:hypothetical protein
MFFQLTVSIALVISYPLRGYVGVSMFLLGRYMRRHP